MDTTAIPSMADPPFAIPPPDDDPMIGGMVIDLPAPPSVNRTRKLDFSSLRIVNAWKNVANAYVIAAKQRTKNPLRLTKISRFELHIVMSDKSRVDLDNGLKALIDYLRKIEVIEDDSPKHMRKLTVEFGHAPFGCRVTVRKLP